MRDRSLRSGTKLAREIQLTDWSTAGNLSNRSSGVQIPRDICTRFGRYLYSTKCSWIIKTINVTKCPPNAAPQVRINSCIYPKIKITLTVTLTLLLEIGSKGLDLKGRFVLDVKIFRASN